MSQREELPLLPSSVLKNKKGNLKVDSLPTLGYLFAFLDSYNFASEGSEEVQEEAKTLINASVLGLIFEKINGHKDGSVFTPGIITMYMCHEAITKTVLQKFNGFYGWNCTSVIDLYNKIDDISKANDLINSIRICDPAVGSGHFLVSALNELIYLKYELGILVDVNGKRIRKQDYTFAIENDELIVTDSENNLFTYNPCNEESRRMQETLFREKKLIIENCLFGVDINPNSVKICRLRLWIELLKNAYYTQSSNYQYLETLPNIDINIKCGNSLVYRFNLEDSIKSVLRETGITIKQYKNGVAKYKNAQDKEEKKELEILISEIKSKLKTEIGQKEPKRVKLNRYRAELNDLLTPQLFEFTKKEQKERQKRIEFLHRGIKVLEDYFQEICSNKIYLGAFEWRLEFPEVLDDEGNFIGFDCIIGNPPYIQLQSIEHDADILERMEYETYARTGDIYCLFYEQGMNVLKENGCLCYITSNKWMRAGYGENLRNYFATKTNPTLLVDFAGVKIFDAATVEANILLTNKEANKYSTLACIFSDTNGLSKLSDFIQQQGVECEFSSSDSWVILSPIEQSIKRKIEAIGTPLKDWDINIYRGVLTGYNEAFIISTEKRNEILANCQSEEERQRTAELIRPILRGRDIKRYGYNWAGLWIIATFPSRHYNIEDFPAVKSYFLSVGIERLEQTGEVHTVNGEKIKARKKTCNKWFETQDSISYWEDFYKPKIVWKIIGNQMAFAYDKNQFIMNNACYIMTGEHLDYLLSILNSQAILWYSYVTNMNKTGVGDVQVGGQNIITFPIPAYSDNKNILAKMADCVTNQKISLKSVDYQIENIISEIFGFTTDERNFLNTFANSLRKKG